jgi:hypothetical protein
VFAVDGGIIEGAKIGRAPLQPRKPEAVAGGLSIPKRILLFCLASGTDWQKAAVTGETVTVMMVKALVERDAVGRLSLTAEGRAVLAALLKDR